jgi:hypothetical protein
VNCDVNAPAAKNSRVRSTGMVASRALAATVSAPLLRPVFESSPSSRRR